MMRICALLLLLIGVGFSPLAQALPCVLHTPAVAAPCPHEAKTTVLTFTNRVADCFNLAAPPPEPISAVATSPLLVALVPEPTTPMWRAGTTPHVVGHAHHPPPRDTLAWYGHRRI